MKTTKIVIFVLFYTTLSLVCVGQTTSVTLQVTDLDVQTWNNGTWSVQLTSPPGVPCCNYNIIGGGTVPNQQQNGSLSGTGGATLTVTPNTSIAPAGTQWTFQVCSQASPSPCFTQAFSITGASQTVTINPPAIRINAVNPNIRITAYQDIEVVNGNLGTVYYNLPSAALKVCNSFVVSCTYAAIGGGTPSAPASSVQFNNAGAFGGDALFSWSTAGHNLNIGGTTNQGYINLGVTPPIYEESTSTAITGTSSGPFTIGADFMQFLNPAADSAVEAFALNGMVATQSANTHAFSSELAGVHGECDHNGSGLVNGTCFGVSGEAFNLATSSTGTVNNLFALSGQAGTLPGSNSAVNTAVGGNFNLYAQGSSTNPIAQGYGVRVNGPVVAGAVGTTMTAFSYLKMDGACPAHVGSCLIIDITNAGQNNMGGGTTVMGNASLSAGSGTCLLTFSTSGTCLETAGTGATGALQFFGNTINLAQIDVPFGLTVWEGGGLGFGSGATTRTASISLSNGTPLLSFGNGTLGNSAGFTKSGQSLNVTGADVTCGTGGTLTPCTSFTTITGLSVALPLVAKTWSFKCDLVVSQATATVADQIGIQAATNGATNMTASAQAYITSSTLTSGALTDQGVTTTPQSVLTFTPGAIGAAVPIHLAGTLETVSASGTTFNVVVLTGNASDLLTIYRGSSCWVY
jgi:hypothetical protein